MLKAYRNVPAADERAIELLLVKLAQLAADFPEIREIDLNPVLADETGVIAVDARVSVAPVDELLRGSVGGNPRFAIRPYPKEWERHIETRGRHARFWCVRCGRKTSRLYRAVFCRRHAGRSAPAFLRAGQGIQPHVHRAIYPDRLRARHGVYRHRGDERRHARRCPLHADAEYDSGEYAILVRSDLKGRGLGWLLMQLIIEYARAEGMRTIEGQVLQENYHDAGNVPGAWFPDRARSRGTFVHARDAGAIETKSEPRSPASEPTSACNSARLLPRG